MNIIFINFIKKTLTLTFNFIFFQNQQEEQLNYLLDNKMN